MTSQLSINNRSRGSFLRIVLCRSSVVPPENVWKKLTSGCYQTYCQWGCPTQSKAPFSWRILVRKTCGFRTEICMNSARKASHSKSWESAAWTGRIFPMRKIPCGISPGSLIPCVFLHGIHVRRADTWISPIRKDFLLRIYVKLSSVQCECVLTLLVEWEHPGVFIQTFPGGIMEE